MDRSTVAALVLFCCAVFPADAATLADKASAAASRGESYVEGNDGWRFLPSELRFAEKLASPEIKTLVVPAITAITDFSEQLKDAGVTLVVLPVPPKVLVQSASLEIASEEREKMRAGWESIIADLTSQGVQTIDLLADYVAASDAMYCRRDTHWSGPGIETAVARLLPVMQSAGIEAKERDLSLTWKDVTIQGDLGGDPETVKLRMQTGHGAVDSQGPVLLLGDSHVLVFHEGGEMHTTGAGLPEQLASVLGSRQETIGVRGSGATSSRLQLARRLRSKSDLLAGKKLVVWVFAGREFTEADMWKKIPLSANKSAM
jgi:hypothetical protein